jgi:hypothetical protein
VRLQELLAAVEGLALFRTLFGGTAAFAGFPAVLIWDVRKP